MRYAVNIAIFDTMYRAITRMFQNKFPTWDLLVFSKLTIVHHFATYLLNNPRISYAITHPNQTIVLKAVI